MNIFSSRPIFLPFLGSVPAKITWAVLRETNPETPTTPYLMIIRDKIDPYLVTPQVFKEEGCSEDGGAAVVRSNDAYADTNMWYLWVLEEYTL